jgi:alkanesulfonate monooxygenase SsuD/methylene tetrahydromethanopterin reductase-like flavin-dependent oxidoreductase (luciferase family)
MLDQLSGGRFQVGIGRGISPLETACFGIDPDERRDRFVETLQVVMQGLTQKAVNFEGKFFNFRDVPVELTPLQQPHPPFWLGIATPESAERAAHNGYNAVSLSTAAETRVLTERYRAAWREAHGETPLPKLGVGRFLVVAETDEKALALARRAYAVWHDNFHHLWRMHGTAPTRGERAPTFDETMHGGRGIAGSPESVRAELKAQLAESDVNYCVGQFAFGDMSTDEALASIDLFTRHVMPALREEIKAPS